MKLNFSRVHSLFLTGTVAAAIALPLVAQASTVDRFAPLKEIIGQQSNLILIKKIEPVDTQYAENPPRDESTGGSR